MTDFDALLKRSFAEAHEPADDGFVVNVTQAVAHREESMKVRSYVQYGAMMIGLAAVSWGVYSMVGAFGPISQEIMASLGLEVARAHAAVSTAPDVGASAQNFIQSMGVGLTLVLMFAAALAGGAVAIRASRD
ncbi:MAG: hypothetical protein IT547_14970 [Hyphomonadaceae bacterium]|jgi:hypothetical protein|nr:hypothetical protein [Hyphomonadaceae bacterium]